MYVCGPDFYDILTVTELIYVCLVVLTAGLWLSQIF